MSTPRPPGLSTTALLLVFATLAALAAAIPAAIPDPPGNDLLLHGHMTAGAAEALNDHGWTAFQDPWLAGPNWGYPLLHAYPHLSHQAGGVLSAWGGLEPYHAAAALMALMALALPWAAFLGGRWLGLAPERAALAALVAATMRCVDMFGHTPLSYSFESAGLAPQAMGGVLAALAIPALIAAGQPPNGSTLAHWSPGKRLALAAVLVSLVVRSHLVAGWIAPVVAGVTILAFGRRHLERRWGGLMAAGVGAAVLAAGFLLPFAADLGAVNDSALEARNRSYGILPVLRGLFGGGFLDGGSVGAWTVGLGLAVMGLRRSASQVARPLAVALGVLVLLMAGRETWGDWMNALPLIGRFHDQRYLLGIHIVVPWLIAASAPDGWAWLADRVGAARRWLWLGTVGALGLTVGVAVIGGAKQLETARGAADAFEQWHPRIQPAQTELARGAARGGAVAASFMDDMEASTTPMSWLRRNEILTVGKPLHHYNHGYELGTWLASRKEGIGDDAAAALGLGAVLDHEGQAFTVRPVGGPWPDAAMVRSDLLMTSAGRDLDGFVIAWWRSGAWTVGQHPTVVLGGGEAAGPYVRTADLEQADPSVLIGLQPAVGGEILDGGVPLRGVGERVVRVRADEEGTWLKLAMSWHPGLTVTLDGEPTSSALLLPANLGVRVPPGEHTVTVGWEVPRWRGPWGAANVLAVLGLLGWALIGSRREPRVDSSPT